MHPLYESLMKTWCDALVAHQVTEMPGTGIHGGIMCPACSRIHGRCGDAVYPLMRLARTTGDSAYLDAAVKLQAWSDHVTCPDGSWVNESTGANWQGITVFGALALGEALRHHGDLLDNAVRDRWRDRLARAAAYLHENIAMDTGVINYPVTCSTALVIAGDVLDEPRYVEHARELAYRCLCRCTVPNRLLYGEGHPQDGRSTRGCRAVDLGYNVEESLPSLALYGRITRDEEVLEIVAASLRRHLEFQLPDGAWDNSWGTRSYKWTYWGSRTSDGCQPALVLLADRDLAFAGAALRNLQLLERCTHNGLLHGGPHSHTTGMPPCIHHTFCHAKALATALDYGYPEGVTGDLTESPCEMEAGVREFPEIATWLAALGPWRATVTAYDWDFVPQGHPSGGALSLLWHSDAGPVLCASLTAYSEHEPSNMEPFRGTVPVPLTPRLELERNGVFYRSINDREASVSHQRQRGEIVFSAKGRLVDDEMSGPSSGTLQFRQNYRLTPGNAEIAVAVEGEAPSGQIDLVVPVVSAGDEEVTVRSPSIVEIRRPNGVLQVATNGAALRILCEDRVYNPVPGFQALPLAVTVKPNDPSPVVVAFEFSS
jgi:hypothetical protein